MTTTRERNLIKTVIASAILIVLTLGTFRAGHCWPCGKESEWFGNGKTMLLAMISMILAGMAFGMLRMFKFKHIVSALIANAIITIPLVDLLVPFVPQHPSSPISPGNARGLLVVMSCVLVVVWAIFSTVFRSRQDST